MINEEEYQEHFEGFEEEKETEDDFEETYEKLFNKEENKRWRKYTGIKKTLNKTILTKEELEKYMQGEIKE